MSHLQKHEAWKGFLGEWIRLEEACLVESTSPPLLTIPRTMFKTGALQGPEIRTGFLKDAKPIQLTSGKEITITTDYEAKGDSDTIAVRFALHRRCTTSPPLSSAWIVDLGSEFGMGAA